MSFAQAGSQVVTTAAQGLVGAAMAAALPLALAARPWRGRRIASRAWGPPLALGLASVVVFVRTRGWPAWPPGQALHWLFYLALLGAAQGLWEARARAHSWLPRAILAVLAPFFLLEFQRRLHWSTAEGVAWTAGLAGWLFLVWGGLARLEERPGAGGGTALGLALATALAAGTFRFAGAGYFALLPGALALSVGLCALLGLWRGSRGLGSSGVAPFVLLYAGMLWAVRFLYELSDAGFLLLSLAPVASLALWLVPTARTGWRGAVAILAPALIAGLALAWESSSAPLPSPYG